MADYNINAITRRVVYTGSAGLGPYSFTFEVLDQNDIAVYFNTTKLTITTDYTVTVNANGTGSVTIVTGGNVPATPDADDSITIVGARDIERTTDFVTAGDLRASALNEQLDGQIIMTQQLAEENKRALQAPVTDPAHVDDGGTLDMTLPAKDSRKGKYLQFNATTGNPEAGPDSTDVTTLADIATDIATLADIEDGTDATDAIQTVAGISSNVSTVAGISSNVTTVAGISSDVTAVAGDATDIGTVAGISSNVTTVAGISSNVTTVAGISADVTAVAGDATDIGAVAAKATEIGRLGTADAVADLNTLGTADVVSDMNTLGTAANVTNMDTLAGISANITTVAGISADVTTVAGDAADIATVAADSADIQAVAADGTDIGLVAGQISPTNNISTVAGIASNVSTVAGISSNVTTVAGISSDVTAVAGKATEVGRLGTADAVADMNTLGTADAVSDMNTLAAISADITTAAGNNTNITTVAGNNANITTVAGISANVTTVAGISSDVTAVAGDATDIGTVATDLAGSNNIGTVAGSISNVNTVGTNITNVNTTAANITGVNSFAERYRVGSADPTTSLDEGDLAYNTTDNALKYYNGTSWASITAGLTDIVGDTTPQLGGDLDLNSNDITGTGNVNITGTVTASGEIQGGSLDINGTVDIDGQATITSAGNSSTLILECTDADANQGPLLTMFRNSASPADSDLVGKIAFTAEDSVGNETGYAIMQSRIRDVTDGTEDGELRIDIRKGGTVTESLTLKENETVFNEAGHDTDFRVESDGNANAIKVDAGNNRVGILNASPSTALDVTGTVTATAFAGDGSGLTGVEAFPSGTLMLFQQTAAPTGWTKQTVHNNKALRVVTGTAGSGGTTNFTSALGTPSVSGSVSLSGAPSSGNLAVSISGNISATTLTINQIPSHSHNVSDTIGNTPSAGRSNGNQASITAVNRVNRATSNAGNGGSHNHGHNLSGNMTGDPGIGNLAGSLSSSTAAINVQYVDLIIAAKD